MKKGGNVSIEAFEIQNGQLRGYGFAIAGDAEDDMLQLFRKLFEKMRLELGRRHIERGELTRYQITDDDIVRGQLSFSLIEPSFFFRYRLRIPANSVSDDPNLVENTQPFRYPHFELKRLTWSETPIRPFSSV